MTTTRPWLILANARGLTGRHVDALLNSFASPEELVTAGPATLQKAGLGAQAATAISEPDEGYITAAQAWLQEGPGRHLLHWQDPRYPELLKQIPDPPVALFLRGDPAALALPQLAMVGSRNATAGGRETARAFAGHLARHGLAITSGLALGIDAAAHAGAVAGGGRTIAVMGTGPDQVYPRRNADLAETIACHGALCAEFAPGMPALRENFPRRNRIISGLSVGTLVVEAGLQSGALITARRASEQGREVFAIPGSIHNPLAKGCHRLIRDGAKLVDSVEHILEELAQLLGVPNATGAGEPVSNDSQDKGRGTDPDYLRLLDAMSWDTVDVDTLVRRSGLTPAEVSSMLLILELEGSVQPQAGGRYQRQR